MLTDKRDLDVVITPAEQEEWLKNPAGFNRADEERAMRRLQKFERHPASADCLSLLTTFALCCLPAPIRTERSFWSVSCLPGTNSDKGPRLACVSLSVMEVFVLGYHHDEPDRLWGLINVSKEELLKQYSTDTGFRAHHPEITLEEHDYRSAGHDQCSLLADDLGALRQLLSDQAVLDASAMLNLRLMRQRTTIYSRSHNPPLARLMRSVDAIEGITGDLKRANEAKEPAQTAALPSSENAAG
jgi:hypothetical protein